MQFSTFPWWAFTAPVILCSSKHSVQSQRATSESLAAHATWWRGWIVWISEQRQQLSSFKALQLMSSWTEKRAQTWWLLYVLDMLTVDQLLTGCWRKKFNQLQSTENACFLNCSAAIRQSVLLSSYFFFLYCESWRQIPSALAACCQLWEKWHHHILCVCACMYGLIYVDTA